MINPLRSEEEAFRFVIGALVYFGAIAGAAVLNKWAGVAVFVLLTAAVFVWWARARRDEAPIRTAPRPSGANERRILVIANETVACGGCGRAASRRPARSGTAIRSRRWRTLSAPSARTRS